jgi:hypothetical protein
MTPQQRQALKVRWHEIERELADLFDGKVTIETDPATCEAELLEEQDAIEFELGSDELDSQEAAIGAGQIKGSPAGFGRAPICEP